MYAIRSYYAEEPSPWSLGPYFIIRKKRMIPVKKISRVNANKIYALWFTHRSIRITSYNVCYTKLLRWTSIPKAILSSTVKCGNRNGSWYTWEILRLFAATYVTSCPSKSILPFSASNKPEIIFKSVLFPLPEGPNMVVNALV